MNSGEPVGQDRRPELVTPQPAEQSAAVDTVGWAGEADAPEPAGAAGPDGDSAPMLPDGDSAPMLLAAHPLGAGEPELVAAAQTGAGEPALGTATPGEESSRSSVRGFLQQVLITVVCGAIFALILQVTLQNYVVEGESMLPNVQPGDRVLVDRLAYRISSPQRGDVVVFHFPRNWSDMNLIKRVVGLPGDTVKVEPGAVLVNGKQVTEPYIRYPEQYYFGPATVPADQYFVLGDNRVVSYDSHQWGYLPAQYIYGKVMVTYWPVGDLHVFGL